MKTLLILAAALGALAVPAAAQGDAVVAPAPGAVNLAAGGGHLAWLTPSDAGWRLTFRRPDGTIVRPDVPAFATPEPLSIGSAGPITPTDRALSVVYGRRGDLFRTDVRTGVESRIAAISSRSYAETAPSVQYGAYVFVRRGGRRPGIYRYRPGRPSVRVTSATPALIASNGTRVAYVSGRRIVVRRLSGRGQTITFTSTSPVLDVTLTRYRVGWLTAGGRVFQSDRFGGSSTPRSRYVAREGRRQLPESAGSIADDGSTITRYLDVAGVKSISPPLF